MRQFDSKKSSGGWSWQKLAAVLVFGITVPVLYIVTPLKDDGSKSMWQLSAVDDSELKLRVAELQRENKERKMEMSALSMEISVLRKQLPLDRGDAPARGTSSSQGNQASLHEVAAPVSTEDVDTSTIRGARLLHTGLCSGNSSNTGDFRQRRLEVMDRYQQEFIKQNELGLALGAILEMEECGMEAERADHEFAEPDRSDELRHNLFRQVREAHEKSKSQYEKARASISHMLKQESVNGRIVRGTPQQLAAGHWKMVPEQSCEESCRSERLWCDVPMMENLTSAEAVKAAANLAGHKCEFMEETVLYTAWNGPWWMPHGNSRTIGKCCWSEFAYTDCTLTAPAGISRLCACSRKRGPLVASERTGMFEHIQESLALPESLLRKGLGGGSEDRDVVGPTTLQQLKKDCIVYAFGVAYELGYERLMSDSYGCTVHAFDCTMLDGNRLMEYLKRLSGFPGVIYHPWCIGEHHSTYSGWDGSTTGIFLGLEEVMARLGHSHVDIIKFDIEGNEWKLFDTLLKTRRDLLPHQLAFELHTYGARTSVVPQELVGNKGERETAQLFNRLYEAGYTLVSKEVNIDDRSCAEFLMVRV